MVPGGQPVAVKKKVGRILHLLTPIAMHFQLFLLPLSFSLPPSLPPSLSSSPTDLPLVAWISFMADA